MRPWVTFIDSGYHANRVYDFCKPRALKRIFSIKGEDGPRPVLGAAIKKRTGKNQRPVDLFILGVDQAKSDIYARLKKTDPGPGYYHFPLSYPESYFKGLTAEKMVKSFYMGKPRIRWENPSERANEPLDLAVYGYAALKLINPVWDALEARIPKTRGQLPSIQAPGSRPLIRTQREVAFKGVQL
jgi:phage terminase large subunit GpA-like protein